MDLVLFNTHDMVQMMTAYQCVLFALLLFVIKRENHLSNFFLAGFLLANAAIPIDNLINFGEVFRLWAIKVIPNWFYVFEFGYWLEGPFLYWYTKSVIYKDYRPRWKDLLLLLPFAVFAVHQIIAYHSLAEDIKVTVQQNYDLFDEQPVYLSITLLREFLRVCFGLACVLELYYYRKLVQHHFSNTDTRSFGWLSLLVYGFLAIWLWSFAVVLAVNLSVNFDLSINFGAMGLAGNYALFFLISILIVVSSRYSAMVEGVERRQLSRTAAEKEPFDETQIEQLEKLLRKDKPYLDPHLNLEILARQASLPVRTLSVIINRHYGKNFFEFINRYRINEAKFMLGSEVHAHKSVQDIMYDSGFNSKASFNNFFRKFVGMTPREYRKAIAEAKEPGT